MEGFEVFLGVVGVDDFVFGVCFELCFVIVVV